MVYRVYVEKKPEFANEAHSLCSELRGLLGITALESVRIICRYDAEDIDAELFDYATRTVFSEPQLDIASSDISTDGFTEKLSPWACPGSWYGSCPRITTFTFESGVNAKALKISSGAG